MTASSLETRRDDGGEGEITGGHHDSSSLTLRHGRRTQPPSINSPGSKMMNMCLVPVLVSSSLFFVASLNLFVHSFSRRQRCSEGNSRELNTVSYGSGSRKRNFKECKISGHQISQANLADNQSPAPPSVFMQPHWRMFPSSSAVRQGPD